jgi:hypothetical protein
MGRFDKDHETLEKMFLEMGGRISSLEEEVSLLRCEIKRLKTTPIKLIEARAWAVVYELRCRPAVNGIISMTSYECADFLENGIDDYRTTMDNAQDQRSNIIEIMKLTAKISEDISIQKTGPKGKPIWRLVLKPTETVYTLKDLFKDYS